MEFAEDDNVIQALSAKRTDQALHVRILPWRSCRSDRFLDAQNFDCASVALSVDLVSVPYQEPWRRLLGEGLDHLPSGPFKSRAVHIAGVHIDPDGAWMMQVARNLLDPIDGFLRNATHLIHDRDPLFTQAWTTILATGGVDCVPIPAKSPNCNPYAERVVRTVRSECLDHFVIFGERHLRHLLRECFAHYHSERYHQGIGSRLILPPPAPAADNATLGAVRCRSRLGGQLNFYLREAA
jgi:hypothetical protein